MSYFSEWYFGEGVRAFLACAGERCGLDVTVESPDGRPIRAVRLEVLLQPRDPAGFPAGSARRLVDETVAILWREGGRHGVGHVELPWWLGARTARACHLRVTPVQ